MRCHASLRPYAMGVLLARCKIGGCTPARASSEQMRLKHAQLFFGLRARVIGGRRKVRHQAFQPDVLGRADRLQNLRRRRRAFPGVPCRCRFSDDSRR